MSRLRLLAIDDWFDAQRHSLICIRGLGGYVGIVEYALRGTHALGGPWVISVTLLMHFVNSRNKKEDAAPVKDARRLDHVEVSVHGTDAELVLRDDGDLDAWC